MKLLLILTITIFSSSTFALVDSNNCPESFSITYYNITRSPITSVIKESAALKAGWASVKEAQKLEQEFSLIKKTDKALCVYTNGTADLYLRTNNGVDEIIVPYADNLYFKTKVLSFSNDYIELAVDEDSKKIYSAIGEVEVGSAQGVNVQTF